MKVTLNSSWVESLGTPLYDYLIEVGITIFWAGVIRSGIIIIALFIAAAILNFVGKFFFLGVIKKATSKSKTNVDDILLRNKVFDRFSLLFPAVAFYLFDDLILAHLNQLRLILLGVANIYVIGVIAGIINAVFKSLEHILADTKLFKDKPLYSYRQVLTILNYGVAIILIISILIDKSPMYLLSALGAATAVLLLVFRDSLLGFTASIQLSSNDMVRIGDWVTVDAYGADGDVMEINLSTIKVQNFDKTISTVPTYAFISNSFKNWRGMEESGGRRIKRSLNINVATIRFADETLLERLKKIERLKAFIESRSTEIQNYNSTHQVDETMPVNGRRLTNVGLFRRYVELYLKSHPKINQEMTCMVRQLQPNEKGLPLEVYCFSADKAWANYESIMADIFDHVYATASTFDLEIFQNPSGSDFKKLGA